jgi:hypothetical protein
MTTVVWIPTAVDLKSTTVAALTTTVVQIGTTVPWIGAIGALPVRFPRP